MAAPEATDTQADVIALLRERAQWYREGCPHLEDGTDYARSGDLARDAGDDLVQALDIIDLLAADVVRLKAAATGDSWRTATAAEQEPLVERLAVMLFEVFDTHGPSPRRTGETDKEWGARIRRQATENIQVALREVLVVAGPSQESSPS